MPVTDLKKRHGELHRAFDELLACYLIESGKTISQTQLMDFIKWSHRMTENPTCVQHQMRGADGG